MSKSKKLIDRAASSSGGGMREPAARALGLEGDVIGGHVLELVRCSVPASVCTPSSKPPVWYERMLPLQLGARCGGGLPSACRACDGCNYRWQDCPAKKYPEAANPCPPMQYDDGFTMIIPLELRTCKAPKLSKHAELVQQIEACGACTGCAHNPCVPMWINDADPPDAFPFERLACKSPKMSKRAELARKIAALYALSYEYPVYADLIVRAPTTAAARMLVVVVAQLALVHLRRAFDSGNEARRRALVGLLVDLDAAKK